MRITIIISPILEVSHPKAPEKVLQRRLNAPFGVNRDGWAFSENVCKLGIFFFM